MPRLAVYPWAAALLLVVAGPAAAQSDIILRASNATTIEGNWSVTSESSAAGGQALTSIDSGWASTSTPQAQPSHYFEIPFTAAANTPYHVWVRLRAAGNSKYNDSVWLQFSNATNSSGSRVYAIGSTSGLDVNLEDCSNCGVSGWGWQDGAYWLSQTTTVRFPVAGSQKLRVQIREDGAQIDQIVLSPATYLYSSPGRTSNDSTIVSGTNTASASTSVGPYTGTPVSLPGRVQAENFDNGPAGTSWYDTTSGNSGNTYRQTDVDIQACTSGGYNLGWTAAGEWMNYSVRVATAGSYTVQLRVASPSGGTLHVGFNNTSSVWKSVSVPATGNWQTWTTVSFTATLGAGTQQMTVLFDTGGVNLDYVEVTSGSTSTPTPTTPPTGTGTSLPVATWNLKVDDASASRAQNIIDKMMALSPRPQVLVFTEAHKSQLNTYINQLQSRTGATWRGVAQTHCPSGAWNGSSCTSSSDEAVVVLTQHQILNSSVGYFPYADQWHSARGFVRAAISVGGRTLQVFGIHLQPNNATARNNSMAYLKSYASNYSAPMIAAGDFNADPDQICTTSGMSPMFVDSWSLVGSGRGYTAFTGSPSMKIDYWFGDSAGRAKPTATRVVTEMGTFSDHFPVVATFSIQ